MVVCQNPATAAGHNDHCTLSYVRVLTRPFVTPPLAENLFDVLISEWNVRIPVDSKDDITRVHWQEQNHTELFNAMIEWGVDSDKPSATLQPYFSFGMASSPFFKPWEDVATCLKYLLLHQAGCHQTSTSATIISHETEVFIATAPNFDEGEIDNLRISSSYYLLRCHYKNRSLVFGYHTSKKDDKGFHELHVVSLSDENWRLTTCIIMKNIARILNTLKDYAIPVTCNDKLSVVDNCIQKIYLSDHICGIFNATVTNMISMYAAIADVPHTDKLVSVEETVQPDGNKSVVCKFKPVGRSYLPENVGELLDALVCVSEALVDMHSLGIMHRDIRWANVFHAFHERITPDQPLTFSREWVLFDFEFAARSPQPAFGAHTLTPGNHAPEMVDTIEVHTEPHSTAVDIWGLGYLILHSEVDIPASHASPLAQLKDKCMQKNPADRLSATDCLEVLKMLQARSFSGEKDVAEL